MKVQETKADSVSIMFHKIYEKVHMNYVDELSSNCKNVKLPDFKQ